MCSARGASSSTSSTSTFTFVFDVYFTNVDRIPARGASSSTSSTLTFSFVFDVYFIDVDRTPARGASSSTSSTSTFSFFGVVFTVYLVDIDFLLRLHRLLHRRRPRLHSINTYSVARSVQHQGLRHNHQTRGAMMASG
jgi:hypothetical protein